jgi:hypothetical protein
MTSLLPDLAPFALLLQELGGGCRGVVGPVPQPLSMSVGAVAPRILDKFCQFIMFRKL